LETNRFIVKPGYRSGDFVKTGFFEDRIVRSLFKVDYRLFWGDLDLPRGVDELAEEGVGRRFGKAFEASSQALIEQSGDYREGQVS
jgi:hypothetical protein